MSVYRYLRWSVLLLLIGMSFVPLRADDEHVPYFDSARCPFSLTEAEIEDDLIRCGDVVVLEDHDNPASGLIRIAVVQFKSTGRNPEADPMIFLDGGPGSNTLVATRLGLDYAVVRPYIEERDVILFDQRGVGYSQPELSCPEIDDIYFDRINQVYDAVEDDPLFLEAASACRDRLIADGVELTAYTTAQNAADVNDIRIALGYEQVNLYGISYGTMLAQYVMRQYPDTVRSVVLDSVLPVNASLIEEHPLNMRRVFKLFFSACAQETACSESYPDLETVFYDLVADLNANPREFDGVRSPVDGEAYDVIVDGSLVINWLFGRLYSAGSIPYLPQQIYAMANDEHGALEGLAIAYTIGTRFFSAGMFFSVMCGDITQNNSFEQWEKNLQALEQPEMRDYYINAYPLAIPGALKGCESWVAREEAPEANDAVVSDIPTLVFAGEFDPITPPNWGQQVANRLENSYFYIFPGQGHGVTGSSQCAQAIMQDFLDRPNSQPYDACFDWSDRVEFVVPQ